MKAKPFCRLPALLLLFVLLVTHATACNTPSPVSPSAYTEAGSRQPESGPASAASAALDDAPAEPYYYSAVVPLDSLQGIYVFLYGPERNAVSGVLASLYRGEYSVPDNVGECVVSVHYSAPFAGHGLLAGIARQGDEIRVDISRDSGGSWEETVLALPADDAYDLYYSEMGFTSSTDGWIALMAQSSVCLLTTRDGGKTWKQTAERELGRSFETAMLFTTAEHGYMGIQTGQGGPLWETRDGGVTWQACPVFLPPGFTGDESRYYTVDFLRNEQGVYCVLRALLEGGNQDSHRQGVVSVALSPVQNEETTVWQFAQAWDFPAGVEPAAFFAYVDGFRYYPDYYGVVYNDGEADLSHDFLHYIQKYALTYKPDDITVTETDYIFPKKLVGDLLSLVYNLNDFDVTTLSGYNPDIQGFSISVGCAHGGIGQDAVYHSVRATAEGDIEVIRDVQDFSVGPTERRSSGLCDSVFQRCVFRPNASASGVVMFTLVKCEILENYPGAAH